MMRRILLALALTALASPALAVCPSTFQIKDNASVTGAVVYSDDGSGNCIPNVKLNGSSITANAGTNLNTSLLALESGGNLATIAGAVSSSKMATKAASGDFADGSIVALGAKADAKSTATDTTAVTIMQVLKEISAMAQAPASTPVTGTFWQTTQPVSIASLPSGAVTNAGTFAVQANGFTSWGGGTLGAMANYGTSPGAVLVPGVNAYVTNTNANGQTTMSASSPVTIASDQSAVATKAASAAFASGSLASGAVVDLTNMSASTGAAPPSKAIYLGANASGATGGHIAGLITCDSHVFKHITSATDTLAVQGVASQSIYICGWRSRAAGVATWFLENTASANANCSSSNTQITGVATEAANTGEVAKSAFWDGLKNTSGNGLCINSTGTGGVDVDIWYTQF